MREMKDPDIKEDRSLSTIEGYKELAAAIVGQSVQDYLALLIYERDDANGRFDKYYKWAAENHKMIYTDTVKRHAQNKAKFRRTRNDWLMTAEAAKANERHYRRLRHSVEAEIEEKKKQLEVIANQKDIPYVKRRPQMRSLPSNILQLKNVRLNYISNIKEAQETYRKAVMSANNNSQCLASLKKEEHELYLQTTPEYHREQTLKTVESNIQKELEWFDSDQFSIIAECPKDALVSRAERAVSNGVDRGDSEFWWIRSWVSGYQKWMKTGERKPRRWIKSKEGATDGKRKRRYMGK